MKKSFAMRNSSIAHAHGSQQFVEWNVQLRRNHVDTPRHIVLQNDLQRNSLRTFPFSASSSSSRWQCLRWMCKCICLMVCHKIVNFALRHVRKYGRIGIVQVLFCCTLEVAGSYEFVHFISYACNGVTAANVMQTKWRMRWCEFATPSCLQS